MLKKTWKTFQQPILKSISGQNYLLFSLFPPQYRQTHAHQKKGKTWKQCITSLIAIFICGSRKKCTCSYLVPAFLSWCVFMYVKQWALKMLYGTLWNTDLYRKTPNCSKQTEILSTCSYMNMRLSGPPCPWSSLTYGCVCTHYSSRVTWCTARNILTHQPSLTMMYSQMSLCMLDCMIYR